MKYLKRPDNTPDQVKALRPIMPDMEKEAALMEAKRCPFCNGEAKLTLGYAYGFLPFVRIVCSSCGSGTGTNSAGRAVNGETYSVIDCIAMAAEKWNQRKHCQATQKSISFHYQYSDYPDMVKLLGADLEALQEEAAATEAKPCPMCGGEAVLSIGIYHNTPALTMCCRSCYTNTKRIERSDLNSLHSLVTAWNSRA